MSFAIIAGIGPKNGRSIALRLSQSYTTVLLARHPSSFQPVLDEIRAAGRSAIGIPTDLTHPPSVDAAFALIDEQLPKDKHLAAAVFNAGGGLTRGAFLELTPANLRASLSINTEALFYFAQKTIPSLLAAVPPSLQAHPTSVTIPHPPSLLITGSTASLRGSANFSVFAAGKSAQRAIAQSLAREFGPRGVHVAYVIVDGVVGQGEDRLSPDDIAETFWHLHTQKPSAWTHELDMRPFNEKF